MQSVFSESLITKTSLNNNLNEKTPHFTVTKYILEKANVVYLYPNYNYNYFIQQVSSFLQDELKLSIKVSSYDNGFVEIIYNPTLGFKNKISAEVELILFLKIENILLFDIKQSTFFNKPNKKYSKFNFSSLINNSYKKEISEFILSNAIEEDNLQYSGYFFNDTPLNEKTFLTNQFKNKQLLAKFNITKLKKTDSDISLQIHSANFIITEDSFFIIAFDVRNELIIFEEIKEKFRIKKGITSNSITFNNYSFITKKINSKQFNILKNIQKIVGDERILEFARLNFIANDYTNSKKLILLLNSKENKPIYIFYLLIINLKIGLGFDIFIETEIKQNICKLLKLKKVDNLIIDILKKWEINDNEKNIILELLIKFAISTNEKRLLLPLFENLRTEFKKKNKNLINKTVFEINYAEFLINTDKKRKAKRILKSILKHLPNETISDILPAEDIGITSKQSGQFLKIKVYELLAEINKNNKTENELLQLIKLQPFNLSYLNSLKEFKDNVFYNNALETISIFQKNGLLNEQKEVPVQKYNVLPKSVIEDKFRHPATLKTGTFYSLQKWISKTKTDDYSSLKEYGEKINATNYPKLNEIFYNLKQIFRINEVEYYISRGEKAHQIIGYEGQPPFIIIGNKHIDKDSDLFLNFKELQFAISVELAHIYFKHSKISANDVWRGLSDKGSVVLDAVLGLVPIVGLANKSIKNASKFNNLAKILKNNSNNISNGKNIYNAANKISNFYKNKLKLNSKTIEKQKLIAASRLMQYTADRVGLTICGDIKSAVRTIFLTSKYSYANFEEANDLSLIEYILEKGEDGTYKNQEIGLRISHLISFYFSEEYIEGRKILTDKKV